MRYLGLLYLLGLSLIYAQEGLRDFALKNGMKPLPADFNQLKSLLHDPKNPLTKEKILLGKRLFFDKTLSLDKTLSCAGCHDIYKGGADNKATAIGYKNRPNPKHLNTPTVLNTAFSKHFFWDGRAHTLSEQAKGPLQATFEMAITPKLLVRRVKQNPYYQKTFAKLFSEGISFDTITQAIASYERTLITRGAFDRFLEGEEEALSPSAKKGLKLFIMLGCKACHYGPALGGQSIQKFPLRGYNSIISITALFDAKSLTRTFDRIHFNFKTYHPFPFVNTGGFLGQAGSKKFRVPVLRNITLTAPYFHNGAVKELKEAIRIMGQYQLGLRLTTTQIHHLYAFLKSLEGTLVDYTSIQ